VREPLPLLLLATQDAIPIARTHVERFSSTKVFITESARAAVRSPDPSVPIRLMKIYAFTNLNFLFLQQLTLNTPPKSLHPYALISRGAHPRRNGVLIGNAKTDRGKSPQHTKEHRTKTEASKESSRMNAVLPTRRSRVPAMPQSRRCPNMGFGSFRKNDPYSRSQPKPVIVLNEVNELTL
jgi:hypothetical protein